MSKSSNDAPFPVYERQALAGRLNLATRPAFVSAHEALREHLRGSDLDGSGTVTPPFESLWIEGQDVAENGHRYPVAMHVETNATSLSVKTRKLITGHRVTSHAIIKGDAKTAILDAIFTVNDDGSLGKVEPTIHPSQTWFLETTPQDKLEDLCWWTGRHSALAFFVISLMHCRNVEQRKLTYTPQPRRRSSRIRPSIEYRTIHLPKAAGTQQQQLGETGTTRLHKARGHFKTYTEDAPLMGRHVGTYYWAQQVRGNQKNGEIISSYKVGAVA